VTVPRLYRKTYRIRRTAYSTGETVRGAYDGGDAVHVPGGPWYHVDTGSGALNEVVTVRHAIPAQGQPQGIYRTDLLLGKILWQCRPKRTRTAFAAATYAVPIIPIEEVPPLVAHWHPAIRRAAKARLAGKGGSTV
jgi:hypothetical protein